MGTYEFAFPMVVGPRYIPGAPSGGTAPTPKELQGKISPPVADTDRVPDASRISPPVMRPGVRNGHDVSLTVKLDAGVPIQDLKSANHQAKIAKDGDRAASITLSPADSVPNKDFVLRYGVVGKKPEMAVLAHTGDYSPDRQKLGNGYFLLMIQPQEDERLTKSPPREIVFLCDVSGSMSGQPTAKVVEAMQGMLKLCRPQDTLQVITFASQAHKLFEKPVPVNDDNIARALGFSAGFQGSGGTEMLKGVQMAIEEPIDKERLRIVVMLTDGYIGNEAQIIEHVGKHCGDQIRFWCLGIGSSPNMFLVDGVAKQGGGMGKQLGLADESQPLVQEIMTRIQRAQLAKIKIDWGNLNVSETYPAKIPELWAGRPVIVHGRYAGGGDTELTVSGVVEGEDVSWPLKVTLPNEQKDHDALAKVWARQKIEDLMQQSFYQGSPAVEEEVTSIALDYKLMSQYTSFVAVDSTKVDTAEPARPPRRMLVPVPLPEGTRWEGFFGNEGGGVEADFFAVGESLQQLGKQIAPAESRSGLLPSRPQSARYYFGVPFGLTPASAAPASGPVAAGGVAANFGRFGGISAGQAGRGVTFDSGGLAAGTTLRRLGRASEAKAVQLRIESLSARESLLQPGDGLTVVGLAEAQYAGQALMAQAGKQLEAAQRLFEQATGKDATTDRAVKRRLLMQVVLLDTAAANFGQSNGSLAAQAIERLEALHAEEVKAWTEKQPRLDAKLDLVLRDLSLAEALSQVAAASKLDIALREGSLDDAAALLGSVAPRVSYLDLRRATAAQALDWILQPARLGWWPQGEGIVAGSERRHTGDSGWTYDVAAIAMPLEDDLSKLNDHQKAVEASQRAADEFLSAVRKALGAEGESSVVWFAPGQILVFGPPARHQATARLIASLREGDSQPQGVSAELVQATRKRFAARKDELIKSRAAERTLNVALAHDHFSWQLLAAAAAGDVDDEALTELQIAWKSPQTAELLGGPARSLVLRSLFTICEAARAMPDDEALAELAAAASKRWQPAADAAFAAFQEKPDDEVANVAVIYAALAMPDNASYRSQALSLCAGKAEAAAIAQLRTLGRVLLGEPSVADRQALGEILSQGVVGADRTALAAFACRKIGGSAWERFRTERRDLVGDQPLPGHVVILINRLAGDGLLLVQAKGDAK
jgi:hypothetical protein